MVKGKALKEDKRWRGSIDNASYITNTSIATHLPVKMHCSMLAEDAIIVAINDYKNIKLK
jgi:NifU-like protein involved in Fe-S cluster formation